MNGKPDTPKKQHVFRNEECILKLVNNKKNHFAHIVESLSVVCKLDENDCIDLLLDSNCAGVVKIISGSWQQMEMMQLALKKRNIITIII